MWLRHLNCHIVVILRVRAGLWCRLPLSCYPLSSLKHRTVGRRRRRRLSAGLELAPAAQRRRLRALVAREGVARVSVAVGVQVRAHRERGITRTSARAWAQSQG